MKNQKPTLQQQVEQTDDLLAKARAYKKVLSTIVIVAAVAVIAGLVYMFIVQNGNRKADELIAQADQAQTDSVATALYKQAADAGYKSGHRAAAQVAIRYYQEGNYEEAIKYLDRANLDDNIAAAGVYSLKGDCYVNLDKLSEALDCYEDAISKADKNPEIVPFVLVKMANIYREQEKYGKEAAAYKEIIDEYPNYVKSTRADIKAFYARALAQENK